MLGRKDVAGLLDMREVMGVVEQAFRDYAAGCAQMPAKVYIRVPRGDFRAMPAAVPHAAGVKWVNVHLSNHERGLPTIMAVLILSDPDTAYPLAIMDATEITAYRTAATSANASRYLARPESRTLGIIGAGRQAYMHLESHALVFPLQRVRIHDVRPEATEAFVRCFPQYCIEASSAEEAAMSDVVCTLTPSRAPMVKSVWIRPGTHINAIGADAPGKQELDPVLLSRARVVVDDLTQSCHAGEINVPLCQGLFKREQIWSTLGEIIAGTKPGRRDDREITIFDSTGLAIEDVATAWLVYLRAKERGGYQSMDMV